MSFDFWYPRRQCGMFPFRNPQSPCAPCARSQSTPCSLDSMSLVVLLRFLISRLRLETGLCDDFECYGILLLIFSSALTVPVLRVGQGGYREELKREGELSIIASDDFSSVSGLVLATSTGNSTRDRGIRKKENDRRSEFRDTFASLSSHSSCDPARPLSSNTLASYPYG